jgi:hypothetical protein
MHPRATEIAEHMLYSYVEMNVIWEAGSDSATQEISRLSYNTKYNYCIYNILQIFLS